MIQNVGTWAQCAVLVFTNGGGTELSLTCVAADDRDTVTTETIARGWRYAGSIAVDSAGEPHVHIQPGCAATMAYAGLIFAEMLGCQTKDQQLKGKR